MLTVCNARCGVPEYRSYQRRDAIHSLDPDQFLHGIPRLETRRLGFGTRGRNMRVELAALIVLGALATTPASAQGVNLSGTYRCVQNCVGAGPAFVTQNGWDLNITNEAGLASRAWIDWPGHIWAEYWNEGAIYSPDGMTIQFDRGNVWQRIIEEPTLRRGW